MNPRADNSATTLSVRTEPVQQRSTERITNLLDAAAKLIDQHGIDGLTTSDVATSSGSSVGVVYRYFPNIQSLLRALAARNLERFVARFQGDAVEQSTDWAATADTIIDAYVALARTEPGFRAVRFGEVIDERFITSDEGPTTFSARFDDLLVRGYGFTPSLELSFELEVLVEIGDALLHRAFQYDPQGDDRFISTLRSLVRDRLTPHAR